VEPAAVAVNVETDPPQPWLLGALLPMTLAWMGLGMAVVVIAALLLEQLSRRQVRRRLLAVDSYLPEPTAWQRSAGLVSYNSACYRSGRTRAAA
jgi:hypothetical protein